MQGKICDKLEAFKVQPHTVLLLLYKVISNHQISIPKHFLNYTLSLLTCFSMKSEFNAPISSHGLPTTLCRAHIGEASLLVVLVAKFHRHKASMVDIL